MGYVEQITLTWSTFQVPSWTKKTIKRFAGLVTKVCFPPPTLILTKTATIQQADELQTHRGKNKSVDSAQMEGGHVNTGATQWLAWRRQQFPAGQQTLPVPTSDPQPVVEFLQDGKRTGVGSEGSEPSAIQTKRFLTVELNCFLTYFQRFVQLQLSPQSAPLQSLEATISG